MQKMMELKIPFNPSSVVAHYRSYHEPKIIQKAESSAMSPRELVMDYMLKRINDIDQTRRKLRIQYRDLLSLTP